MRISPFVKTSLLTAALVLAGCSSNVTQSDKYSGFLKDYSDLQEATSPSGKPVLRWIAPGFNEANYDSMVYNPIVFYPPPQPTAQVSQEMLDGVLNYTNTRMKEAAAKRKPLVTTPGPRSLIFRGAITGVDSSKKGFQVYEVLPIALVVAGTQVATGHRTMNTDLYFEGELIDAATQQPVMKVVRKGAGKTLRNENTPMTVDTLKSVIDDLAVDAEMFTTAPAK